MREFVRDVPMRPAFNHCEAAEALLTLFELLQDSRRRNGRREAILSGLEQLRAAGKFDVEKQRPRATQHAFADEFVNDAFGSRATRNLDIVV